MDDFLKNIPFDQLRIGDRVIDPNRKYGEIIKLVPETKEVVAELEDGTHSEMTHPYCGSMYFIGREYIREPISFEDFFDSMDEDFKKRVNELAQEMLREINEPKI